MDPNTGELNFRSATLEDANLVLDLIDKCEIDEYGEPDTSLEDLLHDWESCDLSQDSWLAFTDKGELAGYALIMLWFSHLRYDFYVTPDSKSPALGITLIEKCEHRRMEISQEKENWYETVTSYIANVNQRDRKSLEFAGFKIKKYIYQMQINLQSEQSEPNWPSGISIRNTIPNVDDTHVHALIEEAFSRPDRQPSTFEDWKRAMLRADIFDPNLWFLAYEGDELVGACLCYAYPQEGWVRQLGVIPTWRNRGLGSALLGQAFYTFQQRGYSRVGLTVDSENQNAHLFYQRLGMQPLRQYEQHEKVIQPS